MYSDSLKFMRLEARKESMLASTAMDIPLFLILTCLGRIETRICSWLKCFLLILSHYNWTHSQLLLLLLIQHAFTHNQCLVDLLAQKLFSEKGHIIKNILERIHIMSTLCILDSGRSGYGNERMNVWLENALQDFIQSWASIKCNCYLVTRALFVVLSCSSYATLKLCDS